MLKRIKNDLRLESCDSGEDSTINGYIKAAIVHIERVSGVFLTKRKKTFQFAQFPLGNIELYASPVRGDVSIKYTNKDAQEVTLTSADLEHWPSALCYQIKPVGSWPSAKNGSVNVEAMVGYDEIPDDIQQAISLLVCHWYLNREAVTVGVSANKLPLGFDMIIDQIKTTRLG